MALPLPTVPNGSIIFLDANVFIYGLLGESGHCADLIGRCRREEVAGVTSTEVIGEVCHRLMVKEAIDVGLIRRPAASALKGKREEIRGLQRYWELTNRIFQFNLAILGSDESRHRVAQKMRDDHGLLTNDSLIVAACIQNGIRSLASRDADFDLISELTLYSPFDLD